MSKHQVPEGQDMFQLSTNQHKASTIYEKNGDKNQNQSPQQYQEKHLTEQTKSGKQPINNQESIKYWLISLGLFVAAFALYAGVWAVESFALSHQVGSHYYEKFYNWSDALPTSHQRKVTSDMKSMAMDLVLQWVMWKAPLLLFTYNCIKLNEGKLKWILLGVSALILIGADVALTIFMLNIYNSMMYFGLFSIVTIIVSFVGNFSLDRKKESIFDSLLPLLCIAIISAFQIVGLPILYHLYSQNLSTQAAVFLTFYAYPFIDLIMYAIILFMGSYTSKQICTFYSQIHFLLIGYEVGFILLIGYTEVEFYYLISYLIFRNIFSNWVMWKWDNVVKLPPILPGWIVVYYLSYVLMFIPFAGIGSIIIGTGYYSIILTNTGTVLYTIPSSLYPSDIFTPSGNVTDYELNLALKGDIFKIAAGIIWVGTTFTQRYSKKMPQIIYSIVYNLFGIYLFYWGLAAGTSTPSLTKYSLIS